MKQSIVKIFTFSLLVSSISFISCVDNEKNLFNADQLKQIYEETFPVKNIEIRDILIIIFIFGNESNEIFQENSQSKIYRGVYIWLSISEVAGYSRFQKMPS